MRCYGLRSKMQRSSAAWGPGWESQAARMRDSERPRWLWGEGRFSGSRRDAGKILIAEAQRDRGIDGAIVSQVAQDLLLLAGILTGQPSKSIGDDVAVMQVLYGGVAAHVQPQPVDQLDIVGTQSGCVRPDVKRLDVAVVPDDIEVELALGLR